MALSMILRRSASRAIISRFHGNLILPCSASVPSLRQFCSSPCLKDDGESLAKRTAASLDHSLVNDLISQVQSLQRDIESLRKSYTKPVSTVDDESLAQTQACLDNYEGHSETDKACSESDKSDDDGNDQGKDSESDVDSKDDSDDQGMDSQGDNGDTNDCNDQGKDSELDKSDGDDDSTDKSSSESDYSDHESLSETEDNLPECDGNSPPQGKENEELLKGIEMEIARAKSFMADSSPDATIPNYFPFTIENEFYMVSSIVLSREYQGELIRVTVEKPTVFNHRQTNDYNTKKSSSFSMDLTVIISCLSSHLKKVELKCGVRPEGISVYAAMDPADGSCNEGVHMSEFNDSLKGEFGKYLEARGITTNTTSFLYKYMLIKANKERLRVLENIQKLVA